MLHVIFLFDVKRDRCVYTFIVICNIFIIFKIIISTKMKLFLHVIYLFFCVNNL